LKLLIIEDELILAKSINTYLASEGNICEIAADVHSAIDKLSLYEYDAIVLDIGLPDGTGLEILNYLKSSRNDGGVIIISARNALDDRLTALNLGADDYLVKPFSFSELLARIHALLRRATQESEPTRLVAGDLSLDLLSREVIRGGVKLDLQPREFALLEYLMRNMGRVVSKTLIIEHVWGYNFDPMTNVVDVLFSRLRSKVDRDFEKKLIHTHRGIGYVLRVA